MKTKIYKEHLVIEICSLPTYHKITLHFICGSKYLCTIAWIASWGTFITFGSLKNVYYLTSSGMHLVIILCYLFYLSRYLGRETAKRPYVWSSAATCHFLTTQRWRHTWLTKHTISELTGLNFDLHAITLILNVKQESCESWSTKDEIWNYFIQKYATKILIRDVSVSTLTIVNLI